MQAEIIAIGTELVLGATVDTNSAYLARRLATVGVGVQRITLVGDEHATIVAAVREALTRAPLVICSGGLGPTADDLTREAIAAATNRPLVFHQTLLDAIAARFAALGRPMSPSNRQQAYVPQDAIIIHNPHGTAPAFVVEHEGRLVAALPGVPQELQFLMDQALLPLLRERLGLHEVLLVREVQVSGMSEAQAGERIADLMAGANPVVGISAKRGRYTIRIAARAADEGAARALIEPVLATIAARFQGNLLDQESLEQRVGRRLLEHGARLALIESDPAIPVLRALSEVDGRQALALVLVRPDLVPTADYAATARAEAERLLAESRSTIALVALVEPGAATLRQAAVALATHERAEPIVVTRGIDFGLPDAHAFVATLALDLLRRQLEPVEPAT